MVPAEVYTEKEFVQYVTQKILQAGSVERFAESLGISTNDYLKNFVGGGVTVNRELALKLGFKKYTVFMKVDKNERTHTPS